MYHFLSNWTAQPSAEQTSGYGGIRENTEGRSKGATDSTITMIEVICRRHNGHGATGRGTIPILWSYMGLNEKLS